MLAYLTVANDRILLALNHALAGSSFLYGIALILARKAAGLCLFATVLALWLWPEPTEVSVLTTVRLPERGGGRRRWFRRSQLDEALKQATAPRPLHVGRQQSRAQTLVLLGVTFVLYVAVRLLAQGLDVDRPFASYLPVLGNDGAFDGIRPDGGFPCAPAVALGAFAVALFHWRKSLGWTWTGIAVILCLARVATGFNFPSDVLIGALAGALAAHIALVAYIRDGWFQNCMDSFARGFSRENSPYCYFLYAIAIVIGLETAMHFRHLFEVLNHTIGDLSWHIKRGRLSVD